MFIAYEISKQLIVSLRPLVPVFQTNDRDLADQIKRAAQTGRSCRRSRASGG